MPVRGWNSVTVPGCVSAWATLSGRFGKLPFADLFEPAIAYARDGYMVSPDHRRQWANQAPELQAQPGFMEAFMPKDARRCQARIQFPDQAKTLELIAESMAKPFTAAKSCARSRARETAWRADDRSRFAAHLSDWSSRWRRITAATPCTSCRPTPGHRRVDGAGMLQHFDVRATRSIAPTACTCRSRR